MTEPMSHAQAQAALRDPSTPGATLQTIVATDPASWAQVVAHPNAYDALLDWLDRHGDETVRAAIVARRRGGVAAAAAALSTPTVPIVAPAPVAPKPPVVPRAPVSPWVPPAGPTAALWDLGAPRKPAPVTPPQAPFVRPTPAAPSAVHVPPVQPVAPQAAYVPPAQPVQPVAPQATYVPPVQPTPEPEPAAVPATKPRAAAASDPLAAAKAWIAREPKLAIAAGLVALLVVIAIIVVIVAVNARHSTTNAPATTPTSGASSSSPVGSTPPGSSAFDQAVLGFDDAQTALADAIGRAQPLAALPAADQLADPGTWQALASALTTAQAAVGSAPAMAQDPAGIAAQVTTLNDQARKASEAAAALDAATVTATTGQVAAAESVLTTAITEAQTATTGLSPNKYQATNKPYAKLQADITSAQAALAALATVDPASVGSSANTWKTTLEGDVKALQDALNGCGGVLLPDGVDQRACGGTPGGATTPTGVTVNGDAVSIFQMPSGNIACSAPVGSATAACEINNHSWPIPAGLGSTCSGNGCGTTIGLAGGGVVAVNQTMPTTWGLIASTGTAIMSLAYGQTATFGTAACLSAQDGVTCWDTGTHHGFKMSTQALITW
ncbi:MAG: hypothetical protein FWC46_05945 [Actinomycetia bacterium]|nr:hypothetical protein [Actinomycetes bacterium]